MPANEITEDGLRPNFIIDAPSSLDKLGAHTRLAHVIVDVLRHEKGIKTIGLLGGWGSGKSTIIRMVQEGLALSPAAAPTNRSPSSIHCFTYDAWLHQSDKPRRAFLEALVAYLSSEPAFDNVGVHDRKTWREVLDTLNRQVEDSRSTTTPTLTPAGLWYLPTLLAVPVGIRLVGDGTMTWDAWHDGARIAVFILGWVLTLAPILAAGAIYLAWRPKAPILSWRFWTTHRVSRAGQSILSIVANKQVEGKTERKSKSPEPSAIEFQTAFRQIMASALSTSRQLVIVVDNLDRLPPEEAMSTWATVRSFFLGSDGSDRRDDPAHLPTVIMPLDETAIARIHGRDDDGVLSRSFVEKTFDLVFHVPAPVLSRWREYLRERLAGVFGSQMGDDWPHAVTAVYESWLNRTKTVPTPRSLNTFVNDLAIARLQAAGEVIHIGVIAYYVANRPPPEADFRERIRIAADEALERFDGDWSLGLAALHYGVQKSDARELFMEAPIRSAIQAGDPAGFAEAVATPGFESYFLRVLSSATANNETLWIYSAARLLDRSTVGSDAWRRDAWRQLRGLALTTMLSRPFDVDDADGLKALIASCDDAECPLFLRSLARAFESLHANAIQLPNFAPYAEAVGIVVSCAHKARIADFSVTVPGGASLFSLMLRQSLSLDVLRALRPSDSMRAVVEHLRESLQIPIQTNSALRATKALAQLNRDEVELDPLVSWAVDGLNSGDITRVGPAAGLVKTLYAHSQLFNAGLELWRDQEILQNAFSTAWKENREAEIADTTALALAALCSPNSPNGQGWDAKIIEFPDLPRAIDEALVEMGAELNWDQLVEWTSSTPFIVPLLQALVSRTILEERFPLPDGKSLVQRASVLQQLIAPQDSAAFWGQASQLSGFWAELEALSFGQSAPIYHSLVKSDQPRQQLGKSLQARLNKASAEEWQAALYEDTEPFALVVALDSFRSSVALGATLHSTLRRSLDQMLASSDPGVRSRWFVLANRLSDALRKTLFKLLADSLTAGKTVSNLVELLQAANPNFLADDAFLKNSDGAVRHLILPLIDDPQGREWLVAHGKEIEPIVTGSDRASRTSALEALGRLASEGEANAKEIMERLGV